MDALLELRGESAEMTAVREQVRRLLSRPHRRLPPVLILGETGTGKTLLARTMHRASARGEHPFVAINCAAIPESLLESELFGYERGAFTDARQPKAGLFQAADGGTLFLDEIGAMPPSLQAKLLTALEDRAVRRLGSTRSEPIDIWIVAATSEDLVQAGREQRFRPDLYYRLAGVPLRMPSLRHRRADIVPLAEHFLSHACAEHVVPPKRLSDDAKAALASFPWPGNVRELSNTMERVALLVDAVSIGAADLGLATDVVSIPASEGDAGRAPSAQPLRASVGDFERAQLLSALAAAHGNLSHAAAALGVPRNTLRYRLQKHGLRWAGDADHHSRQLLVGRPGTVSSPAPTSLRGIVFLWLHVRDTDELMPSPDALEAMTSVLQKTTSFGGVTEQLDAVTLLAIFGLRNLPDPAGRAMQAFVASQKAAARLPSGLRLQGIIHFAECDVPGSGHGLSDADRTRAIDQIQRLAGEIAENTLMVTAEAVPLLGRDLGPAASRAGDDTALRLEDTPRRPSIAVLPLRNLSDDPDQNYFSDGITEDIITGLSRLRWLFVIARYSTLAYRDPSASTQKTASELGVRYLLEGTVRRDGNRLRVTARLVEGDTGSALWSERYDGAVADLFEFQDRITTSVVATLDTRLRLHETTLAMQKRSESLDSYDCVLRALHHFYRSSRADFFKAGDLLEEAIRLDPASSQALAWRAWWFNRLIGQGWSADLQGDRRRAVELAEAAIARDRHDAFALAVAGHMAAFLLGQHDEALRRFERSLEINPGSAFAWGISAATFCYIGEPATALDRVNYALKLSPFDPMNFSFMGLAAFAEMLRGDYEAAVAWARRSHQENPGFSANLRVLTACLVHLDRLEEARQVAREFLEIEGGFRLSDFIRRYPLRGQGHLDRYVAALRTAGLPE